MVLSGETMESPETGSQWFKRIEITKGDDVVGLVALARRRRTTLSRALLRDRLPLHPTQTVGFVCVYDFSVILTVCGVVSTLF